jgi:hypothetical protein
MTATRPGCRAALKPRSTKTAGAIELVYTLFRAHRAPERQETDYAEGRRDLIAACGTTIAVIQMLGIAGPSLIQGAVGTMYFEPGGVSFRD